MAVFQLSFIHYSTSLSSLLIFVGPPLIHTENIVPGDSFSSHRTSPGSFSERPRELQQTCWPTNSLDPTRQSNFAYGNSYSCVTFPKE